MDSKYDSLKEDLHSIGNFCRIATILIKAGRYELLPTVLERLHIISQQIIDEHCIVREKIR